jgi:PAS domain S-box-containing protein
MIPPIPNHEAQRLEALRTYDILDTPAEQEFDDIVAFAVETLGTPIALITFVDGTRQWFKAKVGLAAEQTPREIAFCAHALGGGDLLLVPDTFEDVRFAHNPLVQGEPHIRFYAGAPLTSPEGQTLGTLCVIDRVPRTLDDRQRRVLRFLGQQVMARLELRRRLAEMRRTEETLRRGEEEQRELAGQVEIERRRLAEAQRVARMGSWDTDIATRSVVWSEETHRIFETDPAGFRPTHEAFLERVHPEDRTAVDEAFIRSFDRTEPQTIEHRLRLADNRIKHIKERWQVFRDESGLAIRALGTCQDVTEQKLAEEALRESEARFRGTFEQAAVGIAHVSVEGRFLRVNDKLCAILGHTREELLGMAFVDLTVPEDRTGGLEAQRAMLAGEQSAFTTEKRYRRRDGQVVWVNLVTTVERTPAGGPKYFISVFEDITPRKLAEFRLNRLNRLHTVLSRTGEAVVRSRSRQDLYERLCRIVVEDGRLRMALVVELDEASGLVRQAAFYGESLEYLAELKITLEGLLSLGTIGTALRTGNQDFCNDFANDPRMAPWRDRALHFGFLAAASIPLKLGEVTIGALVLFSGEAGYFQEDELRLMASVAGNISFALDGLQKEKEQRQAEAEARRTAELLRAVADGTPDAVFVKDRQGRYLLFNKAAARFVGKPVHEVLGRDDTALFAPEDARMVMESDQRVVESNQPHTAEEVLTTAGTTRTYLATKAPYRDAEGKVIGLIGISRDITERKRARQQAAEALRFNQRLIENSPLAITTYRASGEGVTANAAAVRMLGAPDIDAVRGQNFRRIESWRRAGLLTVAEDALATGEPRETEIRTASSFGKDIWLHCRFVPFSYLGESYLLGFFDDIRQRKLAEERMEEQAALLDKAQDAILVRDLEDRILYWNRSAERLYGWSAAEAIGQSVKELLYRDPTQFLIATAATREHGEWMGEIQQVTKTGHERIVEGRWTLVRDDTGRPRSILAINTDVTEKRKLEQQFLRAQRMESIGTLAGGIAHDLNNVLAPIMMSIDLLKMDLAPKDRLEILSTIEASSRRGADMVNQVLSFARGVEGRKIEIQVRHLLREVLKIVNETFMKTIVVRNSLPQDLWTLSGDPTQLHQVLLNLCVNARDAMPCGGTLTLSAENLMIDEHYAGLNEEAKPGPHVMIEVEDTGTGIPPETIGKIFDPFFTTKQVGKGTGLGLSSSLAIVRSHGGFLQVYSEPDRGTRFQVYLPALLGARSETLAEAASSLPRGEGQLVLVVDDEASVCQITRQTLEAFGYRVLLASDGAEAVALYAEHRDDIAIVLTDMMMPVMDGLSTIQVLMRMNSQLCIIAASGLNANGRVAEAANAGVKHFLPKPYTAETLLNILHKVLHDPA